MRINDDSILDWLQLRLPTTASGVAQQGICGNYATAEHNEKKRRKRGGRQVKRQQEVWKGGYLKYWNNDWKGKRAGRYDGAKEYRHTVHTGNKVEREQSKECWRWMQTILQQS